MTSTDTMIRGTLENHETGETLTVDMPALSLEEDTLYYVALILGTSRGTTFRRAEWMFTPLPKSKLEALLDLPVGTVFDMFPGMNSARWVYFKSDPTTITSVYVSREAANTGEVVRTIQHHPIDADNFGTDLAEPGFPYIL